MIAVPIDQALAYTADRGWWLDEHEQLHEELDRHSPEARRRQAQGAPSAAWAGLTPGGRQRRVQVASAARWRHRRHAV